MKHFWEGSAVGHIIAGESTPSVDARTFSSINPATGASIAEVALGGAADVDRAVESAWRAYESQDWARLRPADRANILRKFATLVEEHTEELAQIDAIDGGGPVDQRRGDVAAVVEILNFAASLGEHTRGSTYTDESGYLTYSTRRPYGVIGAVAPWNFPFYFAAAKTAAALGTGNAVVLKMAEQTPLSAVRFGQLALDAGVPAGILNVINGDASTGRALVEHPRVPKITFTGSTQTGREILRAVADRVASTHLELGGKSANIVFADADLEQAVEGALFTSFFNAGQICTSGSRLLVHREVYEPFMEALIGRISKLRVGDPLDNSTHVGPLVSESQLLRVEGMVSRAIDGGARALTGGRRPDATVATGGYYYEPTLLSNVDENSEIAREEVFGPVTVVFSFDSEEEAILLANSVDYGLAATVWTTDLRRAMRLADQLDAGILWTNSPHHEAAHIPYEGHKLSGLGEDQGVEAVSTFTQLSVNHIAYGGQRMGWGE